VDELSKHVWVFLTKSKEPPIELVTTFLRQFGHKDGGSIRTDQGGELARSAAFRDAALSRDFDVTVKPFVVEPTGADSPSQNGAVERWNGTLANHRSEKVVHVLVIDPRDHRLTSLIGRASQPEYDLFSVSAPIFSTTSRTHHFIRFLTGRTTRFRADQNVTVHRTKYITTPTEHTTRNQKPPISTHTT
jgi:hypothetical protein